MRRRHPLPLLTVAATLLFAAPAPAFADMMVTPFDFLFTGGGLRVLLAGTALVGAAVVAALVLLWRMARARKREAAGAAAEAVPDRTGQSK